MAKFVSPLLGYNNNVRHKGRVFHIQTEDSGVNHPHIITHLFMDGGRILKSVKKSYAEHVGSDGMTEIVRQMMKEQHKAMFIALRDGQFDHIVDPNAAPPPAPAAAPAPPPPAPAPPPPAVEVEAKKPSARPEPSPAAVVRSLSPPSPAAASAPLPQTAAARIASTPRLVLATDSSEDAAPMTTPDPRRPDAPPSVKELTLDFDALERASHDAGAGPSLFHAADLPPPPKNLFTKERGTGAYRAVEEDGRSDPRAEPRQETTRIAPNRPPSQQPAPRAAASAPAPRAAATGARPPSNEARYAPARPAAIFGASAKPGQVTGAQSIFGDELVSDKSLDEVILSYLAEDLEPPRRK